MEPIKRKRGRPRKAVAPPKNARPIALRFALLRCPALLERPLHELEVMQLMTGGNAGKFQ